MARQQADLPDSADARAAAVRSWGGEVLARYGWAPHGREFACGGCPAVGELCEIFASAFPYHPRAFQGARLCRAQPRRRRLYGRELIERPLAVAMATALPSALVRLVMGFEPTFGLVLRWGHLLGPFPDRVGPHTDCQLCLRQALWAPGTRGAPRLAFMVARCDTLSRVARALAYRTWYQDAAQFVAQHPRPCDSCGRLMVLAQQKAVCPECAGFGVGMRCRCVEVPWLSCFYCQKFVPFLDPPGGLARPQARPRARPELKAPARANRMETRSKKAKRAAGRARGATPFSARLVAPERPAAQPGCKRCAVGSFSSPEEVDAFATAEGATVGCFPCKRVRYWDFEFDGKQVRVAGAEPTDAEFTVLRAGEAMLVRVRCAACGETSGILFRRDGAHVPILTCCKQGRLIWREGDSLAAL